MPPFRSVVRPRPLHHAVLALVLSLMLAACGGGGSDSPAPKASDPGASSPTGQPTPDTQPPTITALAVVSGDVLKLSALTQDNVAVVSVTYRIDDGATAVIQKEGQDDASFAVQVNISMFWGLGPGEHRLVAVATDAAGNTGTSAESKFVIASQTGSTGTVPLTVKPPVVEGSTGLVKMTVFAKIGTGETNLSAEIRFVVDGKSSRAARPSETVGQYYALFDTTSLSPGQHKVVVTVRYSANVTAASEEVEFKVNNGGALVETESNDDRTKANVVPDGILQILGTIKGEHITTTAIAPDIDFFKLALPAGKKLTVKMLSYQVTDFVMSIRDVDGNVLSGDAEFPSAGLETVSYANGATARDVYIRVWGGPFDYRSDDQYRLTLTLE